MREYAIGFVAGFCTPFLILIFFWILTKTKREQKQQ